MLLFFYCEGDPTVLSADYSLPNTHPSLLANETIASAVVKLDNGFTQVRVLDDASGRSLASIARLKDSLGATLLVISLGDLATKSLRIRNWQSAISAYNRCQRIGILPVIQEVKDRIRRGGSTTIGSMVNQLAHYHPSDVIGAVVAALRERSITSNLDSSPWSMHSRLGRGSDA